MAVTLHTSLGDLKLELYCESVPQSAENFLALCASGFYDKSPFHRNLQRFITQTGSPASDLKSKTSTSIWGGLFADEIKPALRHNARGVVSMANKGPDTNGSQFFVCYAPQPHLDGKNTVIGKVIAGWDTLDKLEAVEADAKGKPRKAAVIESVTIHANPLVR